MGGSIWINTLGFVEDPYGAGETIATALSPEGLQALSSSGLSAVNVTVDYRDNFADSLEAIQIFDGLVADHSASLVKVHTTDDIFRAKAEGKVGLIYGFQNAAMVEGRAKNVDVFDDLGMRIIQLTYNSKTQIGGGALEPAGLTDFGREVVSRLNESRIIVDLSHSSEPLCLDTTAYSAPDQPAMISHTGCRALADVPRNKTDAELRGISERGGFVGIYFMPYLAPGRPFDSTDVIAHLDHAIEVCGEDAVGIGTDHGIVPLGDETALRNDYRAKIDERRRLGISAPGEDPEVLPYPLDLTGPDQFTSLSTKLVEHGYSQSRIDKVLGLNFLRYAERIWGK